MALLLICSSEQLACSAQARRLNKVEFFFSKRLARAIAPREPIVGRTPAERSTFPLRAIIPRRYLPADVSLLTSHVSRLTLLAQWRFQRSCLRISDTITP